MSYVCVFIQKMELSHWREDGDEKPRIVDTIGNRVPI